MRVDQLTWLVYLPVSRGLGERQLVQTIVHESVHVVNQLLEECQVECEETMAYTVDFLVGQMLSKVQKTKEK